MDEKMDDLFLYDRKGYCVGKVAFRGENTTPRACQSWTEFEHENLKENFNLFVRDRAMKQGRSEGAILARIRRFMPPL